MKKIITVAALTAAVMAGATSAEARGGVHFGIGIGVPLFYPPPVMVYSPPPRVVYYEPAPPPIDRVFERNYVKGNCEVTERKTYRDGVLINKETTRNCGDRFQSEED